jgi:molybdopterin-guanine dinucleotide biosynthesis protein A
MSCHNVPRLFIASHLVLKTNPRVQNPLPENIFLPTIAVKPSFGKKLARLLPRVQSRTIALMPVLKNVEAFLLAGGKSSRMGRDKAFLKLSGVPMFQRTADLLTSLVTKTTLVISASQQGNLDKTNDTNPYSTFGLPMLVDSWPSAGPLGGIATALANAQSKWSLILACDMPFLTKEWLTFLLGRTAQSETDTALKIDAIVPETNRGLEPLCAIYRASCAPILAAMLDRGVRKVTDALADLNLHRILENEWRQFSPDGNLFGNLNTWQDYLEAQQRLNS